MAQQQLKGWQVALIALGISALGGLSAKKPHRDERALYEKDLKQARWAPPGWLFGPAWGVNNFFLIKALDKIMRIEDPDIRKQLLIKQGLIWSIFVSFGYVY